MHDNSPADSEHKEVFQPLKPSILKKDTNTPIITRSKLK